MNLFIDIGHPAHVHLFKHLSWSLLENGHRIFFSVRSGENEADLLNFYGFNYKVIGKKKRTRLGKIFGILLFTAKIVSLSRKFKADLYLSHGSMYAGFAAFLRRKHHIAFEDTGNMEQLRLSIPVSNVILSPNIFQVKLGEKHIQYRGYHELIYLNPINFHPDPKIKSLLNLREDESYCLLRFISWNASHDFQQKGLSNSDKEEILAFLSRNYRVFICSEAPLPSAFAAHQFPLSPEKLHDAIAGADIVVSEGATVAAEAGVLGIPSIFVNSSELSLIEDLNKYRLVFRFTNSDDAIMKILEITAMPDYKTDFKSRRASMLKDKIDVTSFLIWFIEEYPKSADVMLSNPDYQLRFK